MASEFPPPNEPVGQPPVDTGMIGRIQRILLTPKDEWPRIEATPMTVRRILTGWVLPLAAIGVVAGLIRAFAFPIVEPFTGARFYPSPIGSVVQAVLSLAFTVGGVFAWSLVIDALAPTFKGQKNAINALKLVAFSMTAAWLCGVFQITWITIILGLLGLYSCYLFWVGLPVMMKVPQDQAPAYVAVCVVIGIAVSFVVGLISAAIATAMFAMTPNALSVGDGSRIVLPNGGTIDTGKLGQAAAKAEAAAKSMENMANGTTKAVDPATLAGLLPGAISGWTRSETGSSSLGNGVSEARATFTAGDQSFRLKITDTTALGGMAGLVNMTENKQTATGYKKTEMIDGRVTNEEWDNQDKRGQYGVLIGKRFMVEAEGTAPSIDVLKAAVASVNASQLEGMAK